MNSIMRVALTVSILTVPIVAFAQDAASLSREQVKAQLIELEKAGYNPVTANSYTYPSAIQAAQARVVEKKATPESQ